MPTDKFAGHARTAMAPARDAFSITPHDFNPLPVVPSAVRVLTSGNLTFRAVESSADRTWAVSAGETLDVQMSHVRATGTTATVDGLA